MTIAERIARAEAALEAHSSDGEPFEEAICDLIADLRHLAEREGLDWPKIEALSDLHFEAEQDA